jgi:hypothetical protein
MIRLVLSIVVLGAPPGESPPSFTATGGEFRLTATIELIPATAQQGPACYANCDNSTAPPRLNAADFSCFLRRFEGGDARANCDGSTGSPTLTVADFVCFLQRFTAGCP